MNLLFITGMARSGTTLLDKIIHNQQFAYILSQPFPYFFRHAKKKFFNSIGYKDTYYVLNDYFFEEGYTLDELNLYLQKLKLSKKDIRKIFSEMKNFSGQYTQIENVKKYTDFDADYFADIFEKILLNITYNKSYKLTGFKETQCEDFIPHFLQNGWKCILIIRNPYDVITSIQYGEGKKYTGKKRPTLFHIRNWRKSADFGILFDKQDNFLIIRYEDLVRKTKRILSQISNFLEIKIDNDFDTKNLLDVNGKIWHGNSSFDEPSYKDTIYNTVDRYKSILPEDMIKYISNLCYYENKYYKYFNVEDKNFELTKFREPFKIEIKDFDQDYSNSDKEIEKEKYRIHLIENNKEPVESLIRQVFIDYKIYNSLQQVK